MNIYDDGVITGIWIGCVLCFFIFIFSIFVWKCLSFPSGNISRNITSAGAAEGKHATIFLSHGKVNYQLSRPPSNADDNVVVLIHGFSTAMWVYDELYSQLEPHCCVLRLDLYGRGFSDAPDFPNSGSLFVSQILELLFALGISKPVCLVGYSMGGAITSLFASTYPKKVSRVVLIAPAIQILSNGQRKIFSIPIVGTSIFRFIIKKIILKSGMAWLDKDPNNKTAMKYLKRAHDNMVEHSGYLRALFLTLLHFRLDNIWDILLDISKQPYPILMVWGDDDKVCPYANASKIFNVLDGKVKLDDKVKLITIPGANHNLVLENPNVVCKPIVDFLIK